MKKQLKFIAILTVFLCFYSSTVFAQWISPGKLTKSHAKIEGLTNCIKCHRLGKGVLDSACLSCHEKLAERLKNNKGFHVTVKGKCIECHTEHKGEEYDITQLNTESFEHKKTGYELKDKHKLSCNKCHKKEKTYLGLSTECLHCHTDVHKKSLSEDCLKCHNFTGWKNVTFEHDKYSEYKLTGEHTKIKCENCHPKYSIEGEGKTGETRGIYRVLKFKPLKYGKCNDCHYDIHKGQLKEKTCENCHSPEGWEKKTFEHNNPGVSDFKLKGRHEKVSCEFCHPEEKITHRQNGKTIERLARKLKPLKHDACNDCHYDIHKGQFKEQKCDTCHAIENEWKKYTFRHESEQYKGFKLEGKHKTVECEKCHMRSEVKFAEFGKEKKTSAGKFKALKSGGCNDCHYDIHKGQFKEQKCDTCHAIENEWKKYTFRHESEQYKGFKLEGKHKTVECEKCHMRSEVKFAEFGKEKKASAGKFKALKSGGCNDCHYDIHKGQFKEQKCDTCHAIENEWKKYTFRHESEQYKGFKLEGKHKTVECEKCHMRSEVKFAEFGKEKKTSAGKFKLSKQNACSVCHKDIHKGQYKQDCEKCHTPDNWEPKKFLHDPISFEMKGSHKALNCRRCHKETQSFKGLNPECISCHKDPHLNQFGPSCAACHKQQEWIPLDFKHTGVGFRLEGGHRNTDCADCHKNRDYRNTPSDCFVCHEATYQSAPSHAISSYPHDCKTCHSGSTWSGAKFIHQSFQMTGVHTTLGCTSCHQSGYPGKYAGTTSDNCYACHQTDYQTGPNHVNFSYPHDCKTCHSGSTWSGAKFIHQSFQMTGVHTTLGCTSCHQSGYPGKYAGTTSDNCYACHQADYQTGPNHVNFSYPHDCKTCHSGSTWSGAKFIHQSFQFIYKHGTLACTKCHQSGYPGQYAGTYETDCYACHAKDYSKKHQTCPHECTLCHNGYNWGNPKKREGCK